MTCELVRTHASPPAFRWHKVLFHLSGQLNGAVTLLLALTLWLASAMPVQATPEGSEAPASPQLRLEDVGRGELLFHGPNGALMPAPLVQAAYEVEVNGLVATTRLTQSFRNPHQDWMEGVYVFPLPETAAVYGMTLRVGDRIIAADIQEKQQARATYQQAKAAGKRAGLVEQNRPNIFTTSLANLAPGEEIQVELDYRQTLEYGRDEAGQGGFGLRLPLVVGPRYTPLRSVVVASEQGWAPDPAAIADAAAIAAPVRNPAEVSPGTINNPVTIRVALNAGAPIAAIDSRHHPVQVARAEDGQATITLQEAAAPADRDFVLDWRLAVTDTPVAGLFTEVIGEDRFALAMILPPDGAAERSRKPARDLLFILDRSGSMHGASIEQAKRALGLAVDRLSTDDRFNIVSFANDNDQLFSDLATADADSVARAKQFVDRIEAEGGTEMAPALERAFDILQRWSGPDRLKQIVFITDGAVSNEVALFQAIHARIGETRLFTVGIGSAPNGYFMRKAAAFGRGTFSYVDDPAKVADQLEALFAKLESPVLTDVTASWPDGLSVDAAPERIGDLYEGEPVVIRAKLPKTVPADAAVTLSGRTGPQPWQVALPLDQAGGADGVAALWARGKVEDWMDRLVEGAPEPEVRQAVLDLALGHSLVTRYTSLVAVDQTPVRPADALLGSGKVPHNLPNGWSFEHIFGPGSPEDRLEQPLQTDRAQKWFSKPATRLASNAPAQTAPQPMMAIGTGAQADTRIGLPAGATPAQKQLLIGAAALLIGLSLLVLARRRRGEMAA